MKAKLIKEYDCDIIHDVALKIVTTPYVHSFYEPAINENYSKVYIDYGIMFTDKSCISAGIMLEAAIPTLVRNAVDGTLTEEMLGAISELAASATSGFNLIDRATGVKLDTPWSRKDKLERINETLHTIVSSSDLKRLVRTRSELIDVLWLYSNLHEYVHVLDYENRPAPRIH